jgi:hypothetical protein
VPSFRQAHEMHNTVISILFFVVLSKLQINSGHASVLFDLNNYSAVLENSKPAASFAHRRSKDSLKLGVHGETQNYLSKVKHAAG